MKKMFDVVPDYYPDPELAYALITIAHQEEDHWIVVKLASRFRQSYTENEHVFDVDFYMAKSLTELGNIKAALDICIGLESRFPDHKRASDIQRHSKLLSRRFKLKEKCD